MIYHSPQDKYRYRLRLVEKNGELVATHTSLHLLPAKQSTKLMNYTVETRVSM